MNNKLRLSANIWVLFFLLTCFFCVTPSLAETPKGPGRVVVDTIDKGLRILEDPELKGFDKIPERRRRLWNVIKPVFNFEETSRRALGRHWKKLTKEQREEFVALFTKILRDIYLGKSDAYAGEKIIYIREVVKKNRCKVQTNLITSEGKVVSLDFTLKKNNESWRVYDVIIEGVSIVSNYRSQFTSILDSSSFLDLMEKLREKERELTAN